MIYYYFTKVDKTWKIQNIEVYSINRRHHITLPSREFRYGLINGVVPGIPPNIYYLLWFYTPPKLL